MLFPAVFVVREHTLPAQLALHCPVRPRPYAVVRIKLVHVEYWLAFWTEAVGIPLVAFFQQVFFKGRDFNDLVAVPTGDKHGTLLPVVDVHYFIIKLFIELFAELALQLFRVLCVLLLVCLLTLLLLWLPHFLLRFFLIVTLVLILFLVLFFAFNAVGINVSGNSFFGHFPKPGGSLAPFNLRKRLLKLF